MKRLHGSISFGVAIGLIVFACTPGALSPSTVPAGSGTELIDTSAVLRVATVVPPNLDATQLAADRPEKALIYDTLVNIDGVGDPVPSLATSWRMAGPATWELRLREGVKFHDGEPFNADAVIASLRYTKDPKTKAVLAARIALISDARVIDEFTVQVSSEAPTPLLLKTLASLYILPPKYLAQTGVDRFGRAPIGTGPFMVKEFQVDRFVRFERFEDYWGGKPKVAAIMWLHLPEASTRIAALRAGEVDVVFDPPFEQLNDLRRANYQVVSGQTSKSWLVRIREYIKPWDDSRLRLALNYATDGPAISKALFAGLAAPLQGQIAGPSSTGFNPNVQAFAFDPGRARQLLADAGYPNGLTVKFEMATDRFSKGKEVAEALCQQWATIGVRCNLILQESTVWNQRWTLQPPTDDVGPITAAPTSLGPLMDLSGPMSSVFAPSSPRQITITPKIEDLYQRQLREMDAPKRLAILHELAQVLHDDPPAIFLFSDVAVLAASSKVRGATIPPNAGITAFDPMTIALVR